MSTTTMYRDQHTPAKVGFFVSEFLIGVSEVAAYSLERLQIEQTRRSLEADTGRAQALRHRARRAGAARVATAVVDEFLIDNGGEYEA